MHKSSKSVYDSSFYVLDQLVNFSLRYLCNHTVTKLLSGIHYLQRAPRLWFANFSTALYGMVPLHSASHGFVIICLKKLIDCGDGDDDEVKG